MNVTERGQTADSLASQITGITGHTPEDVIAIGGMLAAKLVALTVTDVRQRGSAVKALTSAMNAQLTLETAGEHRAMQPIGRMGSEDDE